MASAKCRPFYLSFSAGVLANDCVSQLVNLYVSVEADCYAIRSGDNA